MNNIFVPFWYPIKLSFLFVEVHHCDLCSKSIILEFWNLFDVVFLIGVNGFCAAFDLNCGG